MKFIWGLLLGFALGVAAGLLLAPQSGQDTLAQLGEQSITLRSGGLTELRNRANDALAQGRDLYSRTKDELTTQYSKAKSGQY
jgi:gas vesicle protein